MMMKILIVHSLLTTFFDKPCYVQMGCVGLNEYLMFNLPSRKVLLKPLGGNNGLKTINIKNGNGQSFVHREQRTNNKNYEHGNNSCSVDEHVKLKDPGLLMCETASGHRRLSLGDSEELHSSNVPSSTRSTSTQTVKNVGMQ